MLDTYKARGGMMYSPQGWLAQQMDARPRLDSAIAAGLSSVCRSDHLYPQQPYHKCTPIAENSGLHKQLLYRPQHG